MAEKKGDFLRAVIRARRKAVKFMKEHPDEAAEIVAKQYNIELDVAKSAVRNLTTSTTKGVPYWGEGEIHLDGLKRMIEAQRSVGAITGRSRLQQDHRYAVPARRPQGGEIAGTRGSDP